MKFILLTTLFFGVATFIVHGQCASDEYQAEQIRLHPALAVGLHALREGGDDGSIPAGILRIPVVVHVLYNSDEQNISTASILSQIQVLNNDFRRHNADSVHTPTAFRAFAGDVGIEFALATIDPRGAATTGIIRKHTDKYSFGIDDAIKFSAMGGDDAWNADQYLNIWIGPASTGVLGYASVLGGQKERDGVVLSWRVVGTQGAIPPYDRGRTATHEIGHWLGLMHIWGDQDCGDDHIGDTPPQSRATLGCPSGVITSCNNGLPGNMYMNYMDLTNDACMNMFTQGQAARMRSMFSTDAPRHAILSSPALRGISILDPQEEQEWSWNIFPNPASQILTINGDPHSKQRLVVTNNLGQIVLTTNMDRIKQLKVDISRWQPGLYFIQLGKDVRARKLLKLN